MYKQDYIIIKISLDYLIALFVNIKDWIIEIYGAMLLKLKGTFTS